MYMYMHTHTYAILNDNITHELLWCHLLEYSMM